MPAALSVHSDERGNTARFSELQCKFTTIFWYGRIFTWHSKSASQMCVKPIREQFLSYVNALFCSWTANRGNVHETAFRKCERFTKDRLVKTYNSWNNRWWTITWTCSHGICSRMETIKHKKNTKLGVFLQKVRISSLTGTFQPVL